MSNNGLKEEEILRFLTQELGHISELPDPNISRQTQIWYDLKLVSWDFDEFLQKCQQEFGTDWSNMGQISQYVPQDPGELLGGMFRRLIGKQYKPCTVEDLLNAIMNGSWEAE